MDGSEGLDARLRAGLEEATGSSVTVAEVKPLHGGACQDNLAVSFVIDEGPDAGAHRMVLRGDAPSSLPQSLDRRAEFAVIGAATAAGVRTPRARWLMQDVTREGAWSYLLDRITGEAIGRKVLSDPRLEAARGQLHDELAQILAAIHTVTPTTAPDLPLTDADPLEVVEVWLRPLPEPHPALTLALRWLDAHRPNPSATALVHGDFRTGNFMLTPEGVTGILDWEFAHWGSPEEDLAWLSVRDWRFGQRHLPVGGFSQRAPFYAAYEAHSGRPVDLEAVHWWEVYGNVRWAAGCVSQGQRYLRGEVVDLELIAIARRANEIEWEALRLIEQGPGRD